LRRHLELDGPAFGEEVVLDVLVYWLVGDEGRQLFEEDFYQRSDTPELCLDVGVDPERKTFFDDLFSVSRDYPRGSCWLAGKGLV
jgi:hypothetical protein